MLTNALPQQAFLQNLQGVLAHRIEIIARVAPEFVGAQHTETILERIIGAEPTVNWRRWIAGARVLMEDTLKLPSREQPPAEVLSALPSSSWLVHHRGERLLRNE